MMTFEKGKNRLSIVSNPVLKKVHYLNQKMYQCSGDDCILCEMHSMTQKIRTVDSNFNDNIRYKPIEKIVFRAVKSKDPETVIMNYSSLNKVISENFATYSIFYCKPFDHDFQFHFESDIFMGKSFMVLKEVRAEKRRSFDLDNFIFNPPSFSINDKLLEQYEYTKVKYCEKLLNGEFHD